MHLDTLHSTDTLRPDYQDVLDAPPHVVAQIIDGALHMHAGAVGKLDCAENGKLNASHLRQIKVNKRPNLT